MWTEITRGFAALMGAWSVASAVKSGDKVNLPQKDFAIDFLSEAEKYLETDQHQSAAILVGDVLEGALRKLCASNCVIVSSSAKSEIMNAELASRGVYNDQVQQRLHRSAAISDKANCGLWSDFSKGDVELMLADVRAFAAEYATI
jgi:hypothetical protein